MSKGEIAVSYIIAIALGIAVVAIVLYWLFSLSGIFGGQVKTETCNAKLFAFCTTWATNGYSYIEGTIPKGPNKEWKDYAPGCLEAGIPKESNILTACQQLLTK